MAGQRKFDVWNEHIAHLSVIPREVDLDDLIKITTKAGDLALSVGQTHEARQAFEVAANALRKQGDAEAANEVLNRIPPE